MGKEIRLDLTTTATDPDTFGTVAINGIVNAIAFNFSDDYKTELGLGSTDITVVESGGANRELVNVTAKDDSFTIIPSLESQKPDGTADGTRQLAGIFGRGLEIMVSGTEVVTDAIEVVISVVN